ncbi:MAG: hypothetical protein ACXVCE_15540, partial [Bacteriovorax sp.]
IKPYGWDQFATLCTLAKLCTRGKVELRLDGNLLEGQDLERAILNSQLHQQVIIEFQAEFTSSQVRQLKDFYKDFFDEQPKSQEAKAVAKDTIEKFKELNDDLKKLVYQKEQFPFLSVLFPISEKIDVMTKKQYSFFLTSLSEVEDELLDAKEKIVAPIKTFMAGSQKDIYKEAKHFLLNESENFDFIEKTELTELDTILRDTICFAGNKMKRVKEIVDLLKKRISDLVVNETEKAKSKIESFRDRVKMADGYNTLSVVDKENVEKIFSRSTMALKEKHLVASIKHAAINFETNEYNSILSMIEAKKHQEARKQSGETKSVNSQKVNLIQIRNLSLKFDKPVLDTESDVEEYVKLLREALVTELKQGNKIQI